MLLRIHAVSEPGERPARLAAMPTTIVLATDGRESSRASIEHAAALAARWRAHLYVFHAVCCEGGEDEREARGVLRAYDLAREQVRRELSAFGDTAPGPLVTVARAREGSPADEVAAFAAEKEAGLIVTGARQGNGLERLVRGSVAEGILRHAACPVLVVPDDAMEREPGEPLIGRAFVAVDGSKAARAALRLASAIALAEGGEVDVAGIAGEGGTSFPLSQLQELVESTIGPTHPHLAARAELSGTPAALALLARTGGYDLLACPAHERRGLERIAGTPAAEALVRSACQPVLVVPETA